MLFGVAMPILPPGRRPLSPGSRAGLGAALVLLALVTAVEIDASDAVAWTVLALVGLAAAAYVAFLVITARGSRTTSQEPAAPPHG